MEVMSFLPPFSGFMTFFSASFYLVFDSPSYETICPFSVHKFTRQCFIIFPLQIVVSDHQSFFNEAGTPICESQPTGLWVMC